MTAQDTDTDTLQRIRDRADCLIAEQEIQLALELLAEDIDRDYEGLTPVVLAVMNGGLVTLGQLLPRLKTLLQVDYLHATRYRDGLEGHTVQWLQQPQLPLSGRHILIVDDIFDEGHTLASIIDYCRDAGAASVKTAVLLNKCHDRKVAGLTIDYIALDIEDRYVFGYGMDYKGFWRNAPGIFAVARP